MNIEFHIRVVGALLIALGAAHSLFGRYFGWSEELAQLRPLTREVFNVHCFFIALVLVMMGLSSLLYADVLVNSGPLSRIVLAGAVIFWAARLFIQFFGYSPSIWRGNRFYTAMHFVLSVLWLYITSTYGAGLWLSTRQ